MNMFNSIFHKLIETIIEGNQKPTWSMKTKPLNVEDLGTPASYAPKEEEYYVALEEWRNTVNTFIEKQMQLNKLVTEVMEKLKDALNNK